MRGKLFFCGLLSLVALAARGENLVVGLPGPGRVPFFWKDQAKGYQGTYVELLNRISAMLYCDDSFAIDLDNTVYALDSTTIDRCLSLFDWAPFRSTKAAIKLHTLLDLRGSIPSFIHINDGKMHDV